MRHEEDERFAGEYPLCEHTAHRRRPTNAPAEFPLDDDLYFYYSVVMAKQSYEKEKADA